MLTLGIAVCCKTLQHNSGGGGGGGGGFFLTCKYLGGRSDESFDICAVFLFVSERGDQPTCNNATL